MGKVQSKHGSYDPIKKEQEITKKAFLHKRYFLHKLPENLIYNDIQRRQSYSHKDKQEEVKLKPRPSTINSTVSYEDVSVILENNTKNQSIDINNTLLDNDGFVYYKTATSGPNVAEEYRKEFDPKLWKFIKETHAQNPANLEEQIVIHNNINNKVTAEKPTENHIETENLYNEVTREENDENVYQNISNQTIIETLNKNTIETENFYDEVTIENDEEEVEYTDIIEQEIVEVQPVNKPKLPLLETSLENDYDSLASIEENYAEIPKPKKVEIIYDNELWEPQIAHIENYDQIQGDSQMPPLQNKEEEHYDYIVHQYKHEKLNSDSDSDTESFKSCESEPSDLYQTEHDFHINCVDDGLSTIEEESEAEKTPNSKRKMFLYDNLNIENNINNDIFNTIEDDDFFSKSRASQQFNQLFLLQNCFDFIYKEIENCSDNHGHTQVENKYENVNKAEPIYANVIKRNSIKTTDNSDKDNNPFKDKNEQTIFTNNKDGNASQEEIYENLIKTNNVDLQKETNNTNIDREEYLQLLKEVCNEFISYERIFCSDNHDSIMKLNNKFDLTSNKQEIIINETVNPFIENVNEDLVEKSRLEYCQLLYEVCDDFIQYERTECSDDHIKTTENNFKTLQNNAKVNENILQITENNAEIKKSNEMSFDKEYFELLKELCTEFIDFERTVCSDDHSLQINNQILQNIDDELYVNISEFKPNGQLDIITLKPTELIQNDGNIDKIICNQILPNNETNMQEELYVNILELKTYKNNEQLDLLNNEIPKEVIQNDNNIDEIVVHNTSRESSDEESLDYFALLKDICTEFINEEINSCSDDHKVKVSEKVQKAIDEEEIIKNKILKLVIEICGDFVNIERKMCSDDHRAIPKTKNNKTENKTYPADNSTNGNKLKISKMVCNNFLIHERQNALNNPSVKKQENIYENVEIIKENKLHNSNNANSNKNQENGNIKITETKLEASNDVNNIEIIDLVDALLLNDVNLHKNILNNNSDLHELKLVATDKEELRRKSRKRNLKFLLDLCTEFLKQERNNCLAHYQIYNKNTIPENNNLTDIENIKSVLKEREILNNKNAVTLPSQEINKNETNKYKIWLNKKCNDFLIWERHHSTIYKKIIKNNKGISNEKLRYLVDEFLWQEKNNVFYPELPIFETEFDGIYKKVYTDNGKLIDENAVTEEDLEVMKIQENVSDSEDILTIKRIRANVSQIRSEMTKNNDKTDLAYMIALSKEMRKLNAVFNEHFNTTVLDLQQVTLKEIQECLASITAK